MSDHPPLPNIREYIEGVVRPYFNTWQLKADELMAHLESVYGDELDVETVQTMLEPYQLIVDALTEADITDDLTKYTPAGGTEKVLSGRLDATKHLSDYDSINQALAAIGINNETLIIDEAFTLTTNTVIPSNVSLIWRSGCIVYGSYTLTIINDFIGAGVYQLFDNTVTIIGSFVFSYPEWWGISDAPNQIESNRSFKDAFIDIDGVSTTHTGASSYDFKEIALYRYYHDYWNGIDIEIVGTKSGSAGDKTIKFIMGDPSDPSPYTLEFHPASNDTENWSLRLRMYLVNENTLKISWSGGNETSYVNNGVDEHTLSVDYTFDDSDSIRFLIQSILADTADSVTMTMFSVKPF